MLGRFGGVARIGTLGRLCAVARLGMSDRLGTVALQIRWVGRMGWLAYIR